MANCIKPARLGAWCAMALAIGLTSLSARAANIAWVSFHAADDAPSANAATAGFTAAPDALYTQLLRDRGHSITRVISSDTPDTALLNTFDLVIISRSVPSGHYELAAETALWNGITAPTIILGGYILRSNRLGFTTGTTMPDTAAALHLAVQDTAHPVFAGIELDPANTMVNAFADIVSFNGTVQRGISINNNPVAGNGVILATDPTSGGPVIAEWQTGATLANPTADTLGGPRLVFLTGSRENSGLTSEGAGIFDLTLDGSKMFVNAVNYMTGASAAPLVISVVETNGDTDAPGATFTGQTIDHPNLGVGFTVPPFGDEVPTYTDRVHEWTAPNTTLGIPAYLDGATYIMSQNDNRDNATLTIEITLGQAAFVYLLIDNRYPDGVNSTPPTLGAGTQWILDGGWVPMQTGHNRTGDTSLPDELGVDEGADGAGSGVGINQWSSIYVREAPAGTVTLYAADNAGRNMYGAVVVGADSAQFPPAITGLLPANGTQGYDPAGGISFTVSTDAANSVAVSGISLVLNGADVSSSLTVTGTATERAVSYTALEANTIYAATLTAADQAGRETTVRLNFHTFGSSAMTFEAEDWNFDGGNFIDNPVLTYDWANPNSYVDKGVEIGIAGTDFLENTPETRPALAFDEYEWRTPLPVGVPQTLPSTDTVRQQYTDAGVLDYVLTMTEAGEWLNYTRTFTAGNYHVAGRFQQVGGSYKARLDLVTGDRTQPDQTTQIAGFFLGTSPGYQLVALTDLNGRPVTVPLDGASTLRLTVLEGSFNANYLILGPVSAAARLPSVALTSPANGAAIAPGSNLQVSATASADGGAITGVEFVAKASDGTELSLGTATATPYAVTWSAVPAGTFVIVARATADSGLSSESSPVTIFSDNTAPVVVSVGALTGDTRVGVAFDSEVESASATTAGNYQVTGTTVTAAVLHMGRIVELTLADPVAATFTVTVNGVTDPAGNAVASAAVEGQAEMLAQDLGAPARPGSAVSWGTGFLIKAGGADIWGNADAGYMVYKEFTGPFDMRARVDSLIGGDEWAKATLMARESISADSRNQAMLISKTGTYEGNASAATIPSVGGVNVYNHQWRDTTAGVSASQAAAARISPTVFPSWIRLVRETTGNNEMKSYVSYNGVDWIANHTYVTPDPILPETLVLGMAVTSHDNGATHPQADAVYESFSIEPFVAPNSTITITSQPINMTSTEGQSVTFTASATADPPAFISYQWQRQVAGTFEDIAGATGSSFTIDPVTTDWNGAVLRARLNVTGDEKFTAQVTLTVSSDTAPPAILSAGALNGDTQVGVRFNELLEATSATTAGNYQVSGATVTSAVLHEGNIVELVLDVAVAAPFTVTVSGVTDLAGNMVPNTQVDGEILDLVEADLGLPTEFPNAFSWGTGAYIASGGTDLWGTADSGFFLHQQFTGAFDVRARVDSLIGGDEWAKAALMVRESVSAGSRNQAVLITKPAPYEGNAEAGITPSRGGVNVYTHQWRDTADAASAGLDAALRVSPTVFPSWIRLVRESTASNEMKSYISYDGEEWLPLTAHTLPDPLMAETVLVGMAVTSHDNAAGWPRGEVVYEGYSVEAYVAPQFVISFTAQPSSVTVSEYGAATFTAQATSEPLDTISYQWQQNIGGTFVDIAGATSATLDIRPATADWNGAVFRVRASVGAVTQVSNTATLTVTPNTTLPTGSANIYWVTFHPADDAPTTDAANAGFSEAPDVEYTRLLEAMGHTVTRYVSTGTPDTALLNSADLIIISRSVGSGDYDSTTEVAAWNGITTPTIIVNGYLLRNSRLGYTSGGAMLDTASTVRLSIDDPSHPLFAGISLEADGSMSNPFAGLVSFNGVIQRGISINTNEVAGGGMVLATIGIGTPMVDGMVIGEWQAGATMANSGASVLGGHRLVLLTGSREQGITSQGAGIFDLDSDGVRIFLNAVNYMTAPSSNLRVSRDGDDVIISWDSGTLVSSLTVDGTYAPVTDASSPHRVPPSEAAAFYQVQLAP